MINFYLWKEQPDIDCSSFFKGTMIISRESHIKWMFVVASFVCPSSLSGRNVTEFQGRCIHVSNSEYVTADSHEETCRNLFGNSSTGIMLKEESDGDAFNHIQ